MHALYACLRFIHSWCSEMPDYHLARLYLQRGSTYNCRVFIGNEAKFAEVVTKVKNIADLKTELIVATTTDLQETEDQINPDNASAANNSRI